MNIFIAGIHGVGKTYLASKALPSMGFVHTSASRIIKDELAHANWNSEKHVENVDINQAALISGVKRLNLASQKLLLDGHFVLLDGTSKFSSLKSDVFAQLALDGVLLIEASSAVIAERTLQRDGRVSTISFLDAFAEAERTHASEVCKTLGIPLKILFEASAEEFNDALTNLSKEAKSPVE
jgi:adenylate kinase